MEPFVAVIGAVNVDIGGKSRGELVRRDSNPGRVSVSLGGVGRNIAHNLRLLDAEVELLTVFGGDHFAELIESSCARLGIGLGMAVREKNQRSSTYLYIDGPDGDMDVAVSDMDVVELITPEVIRRNLERLNAAECVVLDCNLSAETLRFAAENIKVPIFCDTVSAAKCEKVLPILPKIYAVKPNLMEARRLTGRETPLDCAAELRKMGAENVFISCGKDGMAVCAGSDEFTVPILPVKLVNATGGGDACAAGLVKSFLLGYDAKTSARYALAAGAITVESEETINPALSDENVRKRLLEV